MPYALCPMPMSTSSFARKAIAVAKAVMTSRHQALRILSTLIALFNIPSRILFLP